MPSQVKDDQIAEPVMKKLALITLVLALHCEGALALGVDYPPEMRLLSPTDWPSGLASLRDSQRWVHGYCFGFAEDIFFYAGDADSFSRFLTRFAALPIASHTLTLHRGTGVAKSPWNHGQGLRCDWKILTPSSEAGCERGSPGILNLFSLEGGTAADRSQNHAARCRPAKPRWQFPGRRVESR